MPSNITTIGLEQNETHTVTLVTYEVNGTLYEITIAQTLLWSYNKTTDKMKRTVKLLSAEVTAQGISMQVYSLNYSVHNDEYRMTLLTTLTPSNSEAYDSSYTIINYASTYKSELRSLEFVEFNTHVTLSQHYVILGEVAEKIAKVYEKTEAEMLVNLAQCYYTIKEEAKYLSRLVGKQLQEYNKEILKSYAILGVDPEAISNGGFETGNTSYWTVGGPGDHSVTSEDRYSGSYSLRLGYKYSANAVNGRDYAYQAINLPSFATSVQLSFYYHLFTEDSVNYDWFAVYVAPVGGDPVLKFKKGGVTRSGLEVFGWEQVVIDLNAYAGQSIYIYFEVANTIDANYKTWCYIDDVSVTYTTCNLQCWAEKVQACYPGWQAGIDALLCMWECMFASLPCMIFGPGAYGICLASCWTVCGIQITTQLILCAIWAMFDCGCL